MKKRTEFFRAILRFSSNRDSLFGQLLTPLVNGVRVAGPFSPAWDRSELPKLVLLDGEGLGHTPKSSSSVSTVVSRRIDASDAILLVDSATQPMQAGPLAAMREIVATGNVRKLIFAFTHFEEVKGDNLRTLRAKTEHVVGSAEVALAALGKELGPPAERALRPRLKSARFFLEALHEPLEGNTTPGKRTISQLCKLLDAVARVTDRPQPTEAHPIYDRMKLVLAIRNATEAFHDAWRPRLGLESRPEFPKEHWARIKALSRRLANGWTDEYDTLRPVADLRKELVERIYVFVHNPVRWEGTEPTETQKRDRFDTFMDNLARRLLDLCTRRVWREQAAQWQEAYNVRGKGSTFVRARIINSEIYEPAVPIPDDTPSHNRNQFLREVINEVEGAAQDTGSVRLQ